MNSYKIIITILSYIFIAVHLIVETFQTNFFTDVGIKSYFIARLFIRFRYISM